MDEPSVKELRKELTIRGEHIGAKLKPQLTVQLRQGINDVPALLQPTPQALLKDLHLEKYEISPVEPLHNIKGHIANLIEEAITIGKCSEEALQKLIRIRDAVLSKSTVRCSDVVIMIYVALEEIDPHSPLTDVFQTAAEINEIVYSKPEKRDRRQILCFCNVTLNFVHCMMCREVFSDLVKVSRTKLFGQYFHAIVYHAPMVNRLISPSSLYTELQKRMFNQINSITRSTTNHSSGHMIPNILVRIQEKDKDRSLSVLQGDQSEVTKLQSTLKSIP